MNRPKIKHNQLARVYLKHELRINNMRHRYDVAKYQKVVVIGIRGYYLNEGMRNRNDIGKYDDAICIWTTSGQLHAFRANTDPSRNKQRIASLVPGVYLYVNGVHAPSRPSAHKAFRQYSKVDVTRWGFGKKVFRDTFSSKFWINIHKGGHNSTSSAGCQTVHPRDWPLFYSTLMGQLKRLGHKERMKIWGKGRQRYWFPYVLIDEETRREEYGY